MSTAIIHKKTAVSGRSPQTSALDYGELALNTYDGKLFFKYNTGSGDQLVTIVEVTEDNLAVDPSGLTNSNSNFLSGVLADLDGAISTAVSGGLTSVSTDSTLSGNGTSGSPLSVNIGLDDLSDVDVSTTAPTTGQVLKWNGTNFVPADDTDTTLALSSASVGDLGDVDLTTPPTDGQTLVWDNANSKFVPGDSSAVSSIDDLSDVDTSTSSPTNGQALTWNGANWVPTTISGTGNVTYGEQTVVSDTYTGDGSDVTFDTAILPDSEDHVLVIINGIVQDPSTYSLSNSTVTLATAPSVGDNVELRTFSGFSTDVQFNNYYSYVYTISSDTTSVTGADDNSATLSYEVGKLEVYVNGVRLVNGSDYTATNGTSVTFQETVFAGSTVEVVSLASASLLSQTLEIQTGNQVLTTTTANQAVEQYSATDYRTAKYLVQMNHSSGYHSAEVLVMHDGTNAYHTVYGELWTAASLGSIDADISGGNVRLLVTPANTNTTVKTKRITVEA